MQSKANQATPPLSFGSSPSSRSTRATELILPSIKPTETMQNESQVVRRSQSTKHRSTSFATGSRSAYSRGKTAWHQSRSNTRATWPPQMSQDYNRGVSVERLRLTKQFLKKLKTSNSIFSLVSHKSRGPPTFLAGIQLIPPMTRWGSGGRIPPRRRKGPRSIHRASIMWTVRRTTIHFVISPLTWLKIMSILLFLAIWLFRRAVKTRRWDCLAHHRAVWAVWVCVYVYLGCVYFACTLFFSFFVFRFLFLSMDYRLNCL